MAFAETLVAVLRAGATEAWYRNVLGRLGMAIGTCDNETAALAAKIRADSLSGTHSRRWRLPDALIFAEAVQRQADLVITTDD